MLIKRFNSFFSVSVVQVILVKVHSHKGIWDTHHCSHCKLPSCCHFSQQKQTAPGIRSLSYSCSILVTPLSQPSESSSTSHHAAISASHTLSGRIKWNVIFFFFLAQTPHRLATGCGNFAEVCLSLYEKLVWINLQRSNSFGSLVLHIRTGQMKEIICRCVQCFCLHSDSFHCSLAFMIATKKKSLRCFCQWSSNRWLGLYCQSFFAFSLHLYPEGCFWLSQNTFSYPSLLLFVAMLQVSGCIWDTLQERQNLRR